jgi:DNA replication and repair protein RecF
MWIKNIKLSNFRNYDNEIINFSENINIFYGENAQGKTNIIEAIFLCSLGKSFRAKKDLEMIKLNEKNSTVEIEFEKSDREGKIKIELGNKKNIFLNGIRIRKLSELLGNINIVIFTPDDINILKGGPQNRRKFLDIMISQLRPNYMHILSLYIETIEQRNKYLKQIKEERKDENLLEIWDEKLAEYAIKICEYRTEFIEKIINKINIIHNKITDGNEEIELEYMTECKDKNEYLSLLKQRRKLDIIKGFTTKGIHRDDFIVYINRKEINIYGSQAHNRTAMLSLKLAELQVIYDEIGEYPILLLDDFMSELDKTRRKNFLENIENTQVIITGTEKLDIENLKFLEYNVSNGKILYN